MDERAALLLLADAVGGVFGTEDFCLFLYSLVRMYKPRVIVELGTGLGVSAFWMALAAKLNGGGRVWTIDDLGWFSRRKTYFDELVAKLSITGLMSVKVGTPEEYYKNISCQLALEEHLTFVKSTIDLMLPSHFEEYAFADSTIDLLFSDFRHGPNDVLALLAQFLPRMSQASSIFIDSASTLWPSYLLLEHLANQLNNGRIPRSLQDLCSVDLSEIMSGRRVILVHLTELKARKQNSTAWIKLEPIDCVPQPRVSMR